MYCIGTCGTVTSSRKRNGERMGSELLIAAMSLCGTLIGTFGGILVSQRLINYRLEQLERAVREHNNFARRMPVLEERMQTADQRITGLESQLRMNGGSS